MRFSLLLVEGKEIFFDHKIGIEEADEVLAFPYSL